MEHVNCLVITFNCGRTPAKPEILGQHIAEAIEDGPSHEIIVLSLQEICPMPYGFIGGRCMSDYYKNLNEAIKIATGDGVYTRIFTKNLGITAMMVYVSKDTKDSIGSVESASTGVGWFEMGNKGAVGVKICWLSTSGRHVDINFIAAHLAPHEWALERRNQDWMHIVQRLVFEPLWTSTKRLEATVRKSDTGRRSTTADSGELQPLLADNSDSSSHSGNTSHRLSTIYAPSSYTFVAGDLNYRTSNTGPGPDDYPKYPKFTTSTDMIRNLLEKDQLRIELEAGRTLHGFKESDIEFPPTYKYSSKTQEQAGQAEEQHMWTKSSDAPNTPLGYALHRWPSWCDRVLYLSPLIEPEAKEANVKNNFYKSLPLMSTSDHQPVIASFSVPMAIPISSSDERLAGTDDARIMSPYSVDPLWRERFIAARRKELAVGLLAYLGLTWTGNTILLALFVGAVSSYALFKSRSI